MREMIRRENEGGADKNEGDLAIFKVEGGRLKFLQASLLASPT
jgi:hypothetical protein